MKDRVGLTDSEKFSLEEWLEEAFGSLRYPYDIEVIGRLRDHYLTDDDGLVVRIPGKGKFIVRLHEG